jgi:hypothetical protein
LVLSDRVGGGLCSHSKTRSGTGRFSRGEADRWNCPRNTSRQPPPIPRSCRPALGTDRFIGGRFDDSRLDALFLFLPISWKGILVQYTGRLQRPHPKKTDVRIYDRVDREISMLLKMFEKRQRTYRAIGYAEE